MRKQAEAKKCTKCKVVKSPDDFPKEIRTYDGIRCQCKECLNRYAREQYTKSKSRRFRKFASMIKSKWGVTGQQYKAMMKLQNGICAICGNKNVNKNRRLAVDHCHKTGQFRGLLCGKCNAGIGQFNDSPDLLQKAIYYLKKPIILPK